MSLSWRHRALRLVVIYAAAIAAFVVLMTVTYALPQTSITANLRTSLPQLQSEGVYPLVLTDHYSYLLDNYTDALMADTAVADPDDSAFVAGMAARHSAPGTTGQTIDGLSATLSGGEQRFPYAYYWHGYQVLLRPALEFMTLPEIRYLNAGLFGVLVLAALLFLQRTVGTRVAALFGFSLIAVGAYIVPMSLQFSGVFYIAVLATLVLVAVREKGRLAAVELELFLGIGMLTAFIDLLTAPLLTLGLPLVVLLAADSRRHDGPDLSASAIRGVKASAAWGAGYAASWVTKWVLATVVLKENFIAHAWRQLLFRTALDGAPSQTSEALPMAIADLLPFSRVNPLAAARGFMVVAFVVALGVLLYIMLRKPTMAEDEQRRINRAAAVLLVAPLPYLWFIAANNHTLNHHYFVYRIQAPAVFAVLFFLGAVFWPEERQRQAPAAEAVRMVPAESIAD